MVTIYYGALPFGLYQAAIEVEHDKRRNDKGNEKE